MKFFSMLVLALGLALGGAAMDAEAKRFGGGRSLGMQRQATPPKAPANTAQAAPTAAGAAAAPKRSWMGPLAGIAAGLGLAALASHLGLGEAFGSFLLVALLVVAGIALLRFLMRKPAQSAAGAPFSGLRPAHEAPGASAQGPAAFQGLNPTGQQTGGSMIGSRLAPVAGAESPRIPADFDVAAFERNAKINFIRLQAAYDAGDLDDLRRFTSPEMFAEISMDLKDRQGAVNTTEVIDIQASVTEVVEEGNLYVVSVRFTGSLREDGAAMPTSVDEIWHMTKPASGAGGWVVAGIQQTA
ncbi:MAG: Tim44-like domain-containing protein [Burkholderiaceae bacterium]